MSFSSDQRAGMRIISSDIDSTAIYALILDQKLKKRSVKHYGAVQYIILIKLCGTLLGKPEIHIKIGV